MNQNFKVRQALQGNNIRQATNEFSDIGYKEKLEEISRKYHENIGNPFTKASDRQFKTKLEERVQKLQQEEKLRLDYTNTLLSQLDEQQRVEYGMFTQQEKQQILSQLHYQYQNQQKQQPQ
ncbi:Hypothetical_protein [Hexamita inflata]|uniref:Hypothetical_protein n=1 Tax=Hexamita inflata TaxID=28002 RepID=A0AA86PQN0_9EUKA|nr:Hypothetical protein HINF_LOCUS29273 [Hexamita inflata]